MVISVGGLAAIAVAAGLRFEVANFSQGTGESGTMGLFVATAFVFVAYNGVTKVAAIAEEIKQPERNLPLGILLSSVDRNGTVHNAYSGTGWQRAC